MGVAAQKRKAQPSAKALAEIREAMEQTRERIEWLKSAPLPCEDAKARVRAELDRLTPSVQLGSELSLHGGPYLDEHFTADPVRRRYESGGGAAILPPLLLVMRPVIEKALCDQIDAVNGDLEVGPPIADRPKLIHEAESKLGDLEEVEEAETEACELMGIDVERNPHARIEVVLGVKEDSDGKITFDEAKLRRLLSAASAARAQMDHATAEYREAHSRVNEARMDLDRLLSGRLGRLPESEAESDPVLMRARKTLEDAEAVRDDWQRARDRIAAHKIGLLQIARRADEWAKAQQPGTMRYSS